MSKAAEIGSCVMITRLLACYLTKDLRKKYPTHAVMLFDKSFQEITLRMLFKDISKEFHSAVARKIASLIGHVEFAVYV